MVQTTEFLNLVIGADTGSAEQKIKALSGVAANFSSSLVGAFEDVAIRGRKMSEAIEGLALSFARSSLRSATSGLQSSLNDGLGSLFHSAFSNSSGPGLLPFAKGGVFGGPAIAPLNGPRLGVIGEAGPEAVLPLTRGQDGRLGVRSEGGATAPITVNFNVSSPDAESFARTETQIAAMLSRAVDRGRRGL